MADGHDNKEPRHFLPLGPISHDTSLALELNSDGTAQLLGLQDVDTPAEGSFSVEQCPGTGLLHEVERYESGGRRSSVGSSGRCTKYRKGWERTFGNA